MVYISSNVCNGVHKHFVLIMTQFQCFRIKRDFNVILASYGKYNLTFVLSVKLILFSSFRKSNYILGKDHNLISFLHNWFNESNKKASISNAYKKTQHNKSQ